MSYKDSGKPIEERVEDLMGRMTLEEKVAQLYCANSYGGESVYDARREKLKNGIGTISYLNDSLTGDNEKDRKTVKNIQKFLVEETRLGIPGLFHSEGISGAQIPGATTFPQSLNLAATWEPELACRMGQAVKKQLMSYGFKAVHSPLFDLGRDPRFGRIGETYGEDPYLVAQMGVSFVKGIQGEDEIMAAAKHFVGYGNAEGGRGGGEQQIAERKLLDTYCFPFEAAIHEGGVKAIMNSYGVLNEQAVSTSKWLLTDVLREKLGFRGLVVADYGSITHANLRYRVAEDAKATAVLALQAGMDVEQPGNSCYQYLPEAVKAGQIDIAYIDASVKRVLEMKFKLGLFENPYEDGDFLTEISKPEHAGLSLEIAEKSIVLVKNEDRILPIRNRPKIALIGPSSDSLINFFGGYSSVGSASTRSSDFDKSEEDSFLRMLYTGMITEHKESLEPLGIEFDDTPSPEQRETIMNMIRQNLSSSGPSNKTYGDSEDFVLKYYPDCRTIKESLEKEFGRERVFHTRGCEIGRAIDGGIESVKAAVEEADIVIAVLGGRESMIDPEATCGENKDNSRVGLEQAQLEMMEEVFRLNKPVISIIVDGRPLATPLVSERSKAVLYAWLPAQSGAQAIANIMTGKENPSGKLPVTIVKEAAQIPMYNSRLPFYVEIDNWAEYIDNDKNKPLYPFGYGLSYTEFEYADLLLDQEVDSNGELDLSFTIRNAGLLDGEEVAQLYMRDTVSSIVRPVKQLVGFARASLRAGESKKVSFKVNMKQLAFHDLRMDQIVEPGKTEVFVGASSADIRLRSSFLITGDKLVVERKVFSSKVEVTDC